MKRAIIILAVAFGIVACGALFAFHGKGKESLREKEELSRITHLSAYFSEAGYIDLQATKFEQAEKIEAKELMGGVAPHHIPTSIPLLTEFYSKLQRSARIDTFIVLGPDHFEKGQGDISISKSVFVTPFGEVEPDMELINAIEDQHLAVHDELPFGDHSIHSQMLFISKFFPKAKVVPIVFRSSSTNEMAEAFGEFLASVAKPNTFVLASVDFSHYLTEQQAKPLDEQSAYSLMLMQPKLAGLVDADSPQSLVAMISAVTNMGADTSFPLGTFNSASFSNNKDSTTGYVLQFFGVPRTDFTGRITRTR